MGHKRTNNKTKEQLGTRPNEKGRLRKSKCGYEFSVNGQKINHLLYMNDLKLYYKNEREIDSMVQTVRVFDQDIRIEFGIDKCAIIVLKRGKLARSDGIILPEGAEIR